MQPVGPFAPYMPAEPQTYIPPTLIEVAGEAPMVIAPSSIELARLEEGPRIAAYEIAQLQALAAQPIFAEAAIYPSAVQKLMLDLGVNLEQALRLFGQGGYEMDPDRPGVYRRVPRSD